MNRDDEFGEKNPFFGKHHTAEHKQKMSIIMKGRKLSDETKKKLSEANKGQIPWNKGLHQSDETRRKLSERMKGRTPWNKGLHKKKKEGV